jgi:hypothetical protein
MRRNPCCTWEKVIELAERDFITGEGRALPQRGFSALHP